MRFLGVSIMKVPIGRRDMAKIRCHVRTFTSVQVQLFVATIRVIDHLAQRVRHRRVSRCSSATMCV